MGKQTRNALLSRDVRLRTCTSIYCTSWLKIWSCFLEILKNQLIIFPPFRTITSIVRDSTNSLRRLRCMTLFCLVHPSWQRDSLVYRLRTRSQSTTGTSLERDEFAGRRCVALPILVQKDEGPSHWLASPPGLAVFL